MGLGNSNSAPNVLIVGVTPLYFQIEYNLPSAIPECSTAIPILAAISVAAVVSISKDGRSQANAPAHTTGIERMYLYDTSGALIWEHSLYVRVYGAESLFIG